MTDQQQIRIKALELAIEYKKSHAAGLTDVIPMAKTFEDYIKNGK